MFLQCFGVGSESSAGRNRRRAGVAVARCYGHAGASHGVTVRATAAGWAGQDGRRRMVLRRMMVAGLLVAALIGCGRTDRRVAASGASSIAWEKDLAGALARAGAEDKVVMVDFYTDWCRWCQVMDEKTFSNAAVQNELKRMVVVKLDAERDGRDAARRYRVDGFPTMLFLDAKGQEIGRVPGYLPPEPFLEELADILKKA